MGASETVVHGGRPRIPDGAPEGSMAPTPSDLLRAARRGAPPVETHADQLARFGRGKDAAAV